MNRNIAPNCSKRPTPRLRHLTRFLAAIIGIFLLTVSQAQAEPVHINQVVQTLKSLQGTTDIQLTLVSQDPAKTGTKTTTSGPTNGGIGAGDPKLDGLLSGFPIGSDTADIGVDDIGEEGEVDGTICDCGEILIAGGGFPKWPLLFLAAVPIAFIPDCDDCDRQEEPTPTPTPTPTPNNTPTPTPEPASLLLLGSGLAAAGAGLRRRYKARLSAENQTEEDQ